MKAQYYRLGLIGFPLTHSRSPELHQAALKACGLEGDYHLFSCDLSAKGLDDIKSLIGDLRRGNLQGLNVTIPYKQTVIPFVDRLTGIARAVGAVNTLYVDKAGGLIGDNTDVPGFMRDVQRLVGDRVGQVIVLGAGGSARAVVYGLARSGWEVKVLARREVQAVALRQEIIQSIGSVARIEAGVLSAEVLQRAECDLIINTTPLGMYPNLETCPWPECAPFPPNSAVYDLVYNPSETVLVKKAREAHLPAMNGAGMLAAQAALSFQLWTGITPPIDEMQKVLR